MEAEPGRDVGEGDGASFLHFDPGDPMKGVLGPGVGRPEEGAAGVAVRRRSWRFLLGTHVGMLTRRLHVCGAKPALETDTGELTVKEVPGLADGKRIGPRGTPMHTDNWRPRLEAEGKPDVTCTKRFWKEGAARCLSGSDRTGARDPSLELATQRAPGTLTRAISVQEPQGKAGRKGLKAEHEGRGDRSTRPQASP